MAEMQSKQHCIPSFLLQWLHAHRSSGGFSHYFDIHFFKNFNLFLLITHEGLMCLELFLDILLHYEVLPLTIKSLCSECPGLVCSNSGTYVGQKLRCLWKAWSIVLHAPKVLKWSLMTPSGHKLTKCKKCQVLIHKK